MALTRLTQLSVFLYLIVFIATGEASKNALSEGNRSQQSGWPPSRTKCSRRLFQKSISCKRMGLKDVPRDLFPGVEKLDLSFNMIQFLSDNSFIPYQRLQYLSLYVNKLRNITDGSFHPLSELQHLELGSNPLLRTVTSEMFRNCTKLAYLSILGNPIEYFPSDTLRWLPNLQMLDLRVTHIHEINITSCSSEVHKLKIDLRVSRISTLTSDTFRIDCKLRFLDLSFHNISLIDQYTISSIQSSALSFGRVTIPSDLWAPFFKGIAYSEIQELFMQATYLGMVNPQYFTFLQRKPLRILDLSGNNLSNITKMGFLDLPLVSNLVLINCSIDNIQPTYFARMKGLQTLNLNLNKITDINGRNENYTWDMNLHVLHLAYNPLSVIHERSFKGLTALRRLILRGNAGLKYMMITAFTDLRNLTHLDVSGCYLGDVSVYFPKLQTFIYSDCTQPTFLEVFRDIFYKTTSLEHMFMGNATVTSLWTPYTEKNVSLFQGMQNLTSIDLHGNPLKIIESGYFVGLVFLEELDLSDCELVGIEAKAFEGLQRLKVLSLQSNVLQNLPYKIFQNAGQISTIRLDSNKLKYLDSDLFVHTFKLRNLTLADNSLTMFNRTTFDPISTTLAYIDISENQLDCTCDLKWLPTWLGGSILLQNENMTRCSVASLEALQGKPLMSFDPAELCGPKIALYSSISLLLVCIVVALLIGYRHRWLLNYKLFLLKLAVVGYQEIQDARDFDDFEFHFNIMFAEEDQGWVMNHLRPALEERLPEYNRNVYGDNYLPLGMHYCDAVHYVVEMSYKTIVLVSRAAIQDNWFVIKFRTAADQVNDTQIENMVVIFLEDIPDDELPFLVRLYLSDRKPYLGWEEEDLEFQDYFWQKLTKMLTINLRSNNVIPPE